MTKIFIVIILVLAIVLFPFRRHFNSREKIVRIVTGHLVIIRLAYFGFALLWLFLNEKNVVLSQWDAQRIGIPISWYIAVPIFFLLLYAVFPSTIIWLFPLGTLVIGWTLHEYKTINFLRAHMGVKTDMPVAIVEISSHVLVLVLCVIVLYAAGPYLRKYLQRTARGSR